MAKTYKVRPTNGVSYGVIHTIGADDVPVAAVAEVITTTITAGCTTSGNVGIALRGGSNVNTAVLDTDTTPTAVATKIRASTFTGWTTGGSGAIVTWTATVAGAKTGTNTFTPNATGVTATGGFTYTTTGADAIDGSVTFDFRIDSTATYRYGLVADAHVYDGSTGAVQDPNDLKITYPYAGGVKVAGTLVSGDIINMIASRAVTA